MISRIAQMTPHGDNVGKITHYRSYHDPEPRNVSSELAPAAWHRLAHSSHHGNHLWCSSAGGWTLALHYCCHLAVHWLWQRSPWEQQLLVLARSRIWTTLLSMPVSKPIVQYCFLMSSFASEAACATVVCKTAQIDSRNNQGCIATGTVLWMSTSLQLLRLRQPFLSSGMTMQYYLSVRQLRIVRAVLLLVPCCGCQRLLGLPVGDNTPPKKNSTSGTGISVDVFVSVRNASSEQHSYWQRPLLPHVIC